MATPQEKDDLVQLNLLAAMKRFTSFVQGLAVTMSRARVSTDRQAAIVGNWHNLNVGTIEMIEAISLMEAQIADRESEATIG